MVTFFLFSLEQLCGHISSCLFVLCLCVCVSWPFRLHVTSNSLSSVLYSKLNFLYTSSPDIWVSIHFFIIDTSITIVLFVYMESHKFWSYIYVKIWNSLIHCNFIFSIVRKWLGRFLFHQYRSVTLIKFWSDRQKDH